MLRDAIEGFPGGFALFDHDDRLILCNQRHREYYTEISDILVPGVSFEELARAVAQRNIVAGIESTDAYVASRLRRRRHATEPLEQQMSNGRWVLVNKQGTRDGRMVVVRTDITQKKRAFNALNESEEHFARTH